MFLLKTICIQGTNVVVPNDFTLLDNEIFELKDCNPQQIQKVISYYLEDKIHEVCTENKKLASLYVITSILAGNDNFNLLSELDDLDVNLIPQIFKINVSSSSEDLEILIDKIKWFWK